MRKRIPVIIALFGLMTGIVIGITGCTNKSGQSFDIAAISSYREIPGITNEEIAAIEALKERRQGFSLWQMPSTEGFVLPNGVYAGFSPKFCNLLSDIFEIPFNLMFDNNEAIDFTYEFAVNPEQLKKYISISNPIIQRSLAVITYGSRKIEVPDDLNGFKVGILHDSAIANLIATAYPYLKFEIIPIPNTAAEAGMLKRGEVDAIIGISTRMAYDYDNTDFTCIYNLLPFAFIPVGLASDNIELKPIISILDKYIAAGGINKIHDLYKEGHYEYKRHSVYQSFSGEEREYVDNHIANQIKVPVVLESDSYPISFYNEKEKTFQGIAPDILAEISSLTGIEFEVINEKNATWSEIQEMLRTGEAALVSELLYTKEREEYFIWTATPYFSSPFAFISRADYPFLDIPQIAQTPIGIVRNTYYEDMYRRWFPNSNNIVLYDFQDEALDALGRGEVDLVFTSEYILLYQLNYREKSGFKTNFVFSAVTSSLFGFNKNEEILCSIIGKVMPYTQMEAISKDWLSRIYDYSRIIERVRFIIAIIFAVLLLLVLIIIAILLFNIVKKGRIIDQQTDILQEALDKSYIAHKTVEYERMKYKLVIESMDIALWEMEVISPDMEVPANSGKWKWSKEFRNILGFTDENDFPDSIESFFKCLHPDDTEKSVDAFNKHFTDRSGKTPYNIEYRLYHKNGECLYFDGFGTTLRDSEGIPIRVSGAIRNITEIKKMTKALKKRETMLNALNKTAITFLSLNKESFEQMMAQGIGQLADLFDIDRFSLFRNFLMPDGLHATQIYRWDKALGGTTSPNKTYTSVRYSVFAPSWEHILGRGDVVNGPARFMPEQEAATLKIAGVISAFIVPVFIDDVFWGFALFEDRYNERIFDDNCVEIMRSTAFLCANMVIRNEMESEREKLMKDLYHRDNLLKAVNSAASILLTVKDEENFHASLMEGMEIIGRSVDVDCVELWQNEMIDGELYAVIKNYWFNDKAMNSKPVAALQKFSYNSTPDWERRLSEGECIRGAINNLSPKDRDFVVPLGIKSLMIIPVFMENRLWGMCCIDDYTNYRNFSEEEVSILRSCAIFFVNALIRNDMVKKNRDTSIQLEASLTQATAASKAKGDFLSNMSHEMRTPMNAIIGMTTIGKKAKGMEEKDYALNKIKDASTHLLGVINDILDMAKIEANKLELVPVDFNFEKMLQRVISVVNFRVDEKQQHFSVNIDSNMPDFLIGDDQRLAQVITNLLANAIKFTPIGGKIQLNVSLISEVNDECELRIEVIDNGIGIAPDQCDKLFEMFEQAETGTSREYGGTGLGLVISKNIIELMGGKIWVESEISKGAKFIFTIKSKRGTKNRRSLLSPNVNWGNIKIMVVDDSIEILHQFQEIFGNLDIKCDIALDGFEACRLIEEHGEYDLYFVDWRMPGMNGIELTGKIKSRIDGRPSVVIMITAMDWKQIKTDASNAGVDKHLLKPLSSSMVIDCVNECLGALSVSTEEKQVKDIFTGKTMLLAEDIEINREILIALLEDTGIVIDCVVNGKEAVEAVEAAPGKYDIVFMDVQMPKMDGLEATRLIRAFEAEQKQLSEKSHEKIPIVAMTANVFKDDIEKCLEAGMDDHLGKPLDIDKTLEILEKYLG